MRHLEAREIVAGDRGIGCNVERPSYGRVGGSLFERWKHPPMRSSSIGKIRDSLTGRFGKLVKSRARAAGMNYREFREWVDEIVGEGIAVALADHEAWDHTRGDFLQWAFLKTQSLIREELRTMNRLDTIPLDYSRLSATASKALDPARKYEVKAHLQEILENLTDDQRDAVLFRHLLDLKPKEIQRLTGQSYKSVASLLSRGLKKAARYIEDENVSR